MKQKKQEEIKLLFISLKTRPYKWFSLANTVDDVNIAMEKVNVAVLGATGAVGTEMLKTLEKRNFPDLYL